MGTQPRVAEAEEQCSPDSCDTFPMAMATVTRACVYCYNDHRSFTNFMFATFSSQLCEGLDFPHHTYPLGYIYVHTFGLLLCSARIACKSSLTSVMVGRSAGSCCHIRSRSCTTSEPQRFRIAVVDGLRRPAENSVGRWHVFHSQTHLIFLVPTASIIQN
jgi:hypothetical protein